VGAGAGSSVDIAAGATAAATAAATTGATAAGAAAAAAAAAATAGVGVGVGDGVGVGVGGDTHDAVPAGDSSMEVQEVDPAGRSSSAANSDGGNSDENGGWTGVRTLRVRAKGAATKEIDKGRTNNQYLHTHLCTQKRPPYQRECQLEDGKLQ